MTNEKLNIGILGASAIAPNAIIAPSKDIPELSLFGIASSNRERAEAFAKKHNIMYSFGNYYELINHKDVNTIYISLTNEVHCKYAIESIRNGKNVIVEKPICLNFNEFKQIEEEARKNKVKVLEALMAQYHPWQNVVREIIDEKKFGEVQKIFSYNQFLLENKSNYRYCREKGGGAFFDLGCYCLQFVQKIVGLDFKSLSAESFCNSNNVDIEFEAKLITNNNIPVQICCSFSKPFKADHIIEFDNGIIEIRNFFRPIFGYNKMHINYASKDQNQKQRISFDAMNYYYNQLRYFIESDIDGCNIKLKETGERIFLMEQLYKKAKMIQI